MVKNKAVAGTYSNPSDIGSIFGLKNLVIIAPLLLIAVFCLSFAQMKAMTTQNIMRQEADSNKQNSDLKPLPLITQPTLPTLNESVETKAPDPVPPPMNQYMSSGQKPDKVGPSSTNSGNALQPNSGNIEKKINDDLQATRQTIRLEEAKF